MIDGIRTMEDADHAQFLTVRVTVAEAFHRFQTLHRALLQGRPAPLGAVESFAIIATHEIRYRKLYTSDRILDEAVATCRRRTKSHELSARCEKTFNLLGP
jgi:hypothetical protein